MGQIETARATPVTYVHYALDVFPVILLNEWLSNRAILKY